MAAAQGVVAGGKATNGSREDYALARYNPDGSLDGKVMTDFLGHNDDARSVALDDDGRIFAAGIAYSPETAQQFAIARFFGGGDTAPPKVGPPEGSLVANSALGASDAVPVRLSWSATDAEGEVTGYALQRSTDGGPYEDVALTDATATTKTIGLEPGHDHRFRVRATDDNGNRSVWKYGPA